MESVLKSTRHYRRLSVVESVFSYTGSVLAARPWDSPGFVEVDLHLPGTDMRHWTECTHIKCKVGAFSYRDYSPSFWDAETFTCTLLVDTGHDGPGALWARTVQAGDPLYYLKIGSSHQALPAGGRGVLLGDATAAGHFAGMRQISGPDAQMRGAIEWSSVNHCREYSKYFSSQSLDALARKAEPGEALKEWVHGFDARPDDYYFLAGGVKMVSRLREFLKTAGVSGRRINAQGFWK